MGIWNLLEKTHVLMLCTESFSKAECLLLVEALAVLGIKSNLRRRNAAKDTYRIRISSTSMPLVKQLIMPYMELTPEYLYKLGISKDS